MFKLNGLLAALAALVFVFAFAADPLLAQSPPVDPSQIRLQQTHDPLSAKKQSGKSATDQKELKAGSRTKKVPENEPQIRVVPMFDPAEPD